MSFSNSYKGNQNKVKGNNSLQQIDMVTNSENLVAAMSNLVLPKLDDPKEKSPCQMHGRYSRIILRLTDFKNKAADGKSITVSFYLKPAEIRRLFRIVQQKKGADTYRFYSFKKQVHKFTDATKKRIEASSLTIERQPYEMDFNTKKPKLDAKGQPKLMGLPWTISCSVGSCAADATGSGFKADKSVRKKLSDDQFADFLCNVVSHINVWETVIGGKFLKEVMDKIAAQRMTHSVDDEDSEQPEILYAPQGGYAPLGDDRI